jgi:hypothetical protein
MNPPCQELVAKDLHGTEWNFRHIYRGMLGVMVLMHGTCVRSFFGNLWYLGCVAEGDCGSTQVILAGIF